MNLKKQQIYFNVVLMREMVSAKNRADLHTHVSWVCIEILNLETVAGILCTE